MNRCEIGDCREIMRRWIAEGVRVQTVDALTETQVAYLAGLIDGEGSLESQRELQPNGTTHCYKLRLAFVFATPEPLATVGRWLDLSVRRYKSTDPRRSDRYRAEIHKGKSVALLVRVLRYLILKRQQAELILFIEAVRHAYSPARAHFGKSRFQAMPSEAVERMHGLHVQLRALKSNKRRADARV